MNTEDTEDNVSSHLFLVRLWSKEVDGSAEREWGGRVQHILSGEGHNFEEWDGLIRFLVMMLPTLNALQQPQTTDKVNHE